MSPVRLTVYVASCQRFNIPIFGFILDINSLRLSNVFNCHVCQCPGIVDDIPHLYAWGRQTAPLSLKAPDDAARLKPPVDGLPRIHGSATSPHLHAGSM